MGTLLYALLVGPITQFFLPRFAYRERRAAQAAEVHAVGAAEKLERPA
ncbi:hypothetical protein [Streptomyces sp. NPDC005780]